MKKPVPLRVTGQVGGLMALARFVVRAARVLLGLLLLAMVLLNVANALSRYLLGQAITGSDELLVFGMVWLVFLGTAFVTAERRQLSFDVILQRLPAGLSRRVQLGGDIIAVGLLGFVTWQSFQVVQRLAALDQWSMAAAVPSYVPHAAILVGFGLTVVILLTMVIRSLATALQGAGSLGGGRG